MSDQYRMEKAAEEFTHSAGNDRRRAPLHALRLEHPPGFVLLRLSDVTLTATPNQRHEDSDRVGGESEFKQRLIAERQKANAYH